MADEALNRILNMFPDGNVCLVFADHRSCKISEQVYGTAKNSNLPNVFFVGYSVSDYRNCTFDYQGIHVLFSEEEYDSVVRSLPDLKLKKGQVSAMLFTKDSHQSFVLGSVKSTVNARLKRIDSDIECGIAGSGMSKASFVLALSFLIILLIGAIIFIVWALSYPGDSWLDYIRLAALLMFPIAGIIILIEMNKHTCRMPKTYPDPDLSMILAFIPGLGLLYMKKKRGLILLALLAAYAGLIATAFTGPAGITLSEDDIFAVTMFCIFSIVMLCTISLMETQFFCSERYGDKWTSLMSRTIDGPKDMYVCILLYVLMIILVPLLCGLRPYMILLLAFSLAYPIREHMLRKKLKDL